MKYFAYLRKSSEGEARQAQSIDTQKRIITDYAIKNGLNIIEYIIETKSAKSDGNRPQFDQMVHKIIKGEANGLVVAHIDRISRNGVDSGLITKLFDNGLLKEIRTPSKIYSTSEDILMLGIEFVFAGDYSRRLSKRVKEGRESKLLKGEYPSPAPLGYQNKDFKIAVDKIKSKYIIKAFNLYVSGDHSLKEISTILFNEGFRTKRGQKVYKSVIHRILTNPFYYGVMIDRNKEYKGIHKPLITKSLFDQVQDVLNAGNKPRKRIHNFLFRNYLFCEECGCKMTAVIKKEKYIYYYCTNGKSNCSQHEKYLKEKSVNSLICGLIRDFTPDKELINLSLDLYSQELKNEQINKVDNFEEIKKQINNLEVKFKRLEDMRLDNEISSERFLIKRKEITNEKECLEQELKNTQNINIETTLELLEKTKDYVFSLETLFNSGDKQIQSDLLKSLLWNCTIKNEIIHKVTYKKPFAYFKNMSKTNDISLMRA